MENLAKLWPISPWGFALLVALTLLWVEAAYSQGQECFVYYSADQSSAGDVDVLMAPGRDSASSVTRTSFAIIGGAVASESETRPLSESLLLDGRTRYCVGGPVQLDRLEPASPGVFSADYVFLDAAGDGLRTASLSAIEGAVQRAFADSPDGCATIGAFRVAYVRAGAELAVEGPQPLTLSVGPDQDLPPTALCRPIQPPE